MSEAKPTRASLRTGLGRVRGLGSARDGVSHWWMQRLAAVTLVPLTVWVVFSMASLAGASQAAVQAWIATPWVTVLLVVLVVATFLHLAMGLQTVIEDYIRNEVAKIAALMLAKALCTLLCIAGVLAILRIAL